MEHTVAQFVQTALQASYRFDSKRCH